MKGKVQAAVRVEKMKTEVWEFDVPEIPRDAGLLKVEATGVCGSDWPRYHEHRRGPSILGHHIVGVIHKIGDEASRRWEVKEGDRVALEEYLPCGYCRFCRSGEYRSCFTTDTRREHFLRYGSTPISIKPSLWGGYSQYLYLHPSAIVHRIPGNIPSEQAALTLPLANGVQWAVVEGGTRPGKIVVIQGPGQQGLGCVIAAKAAGASCIIVSGLSRDANRLEAARALGADYTIAADRESLKDRVMDITGGDLADIFVDVSSGGAETIRNAVEITRKRGTVVLAASKGGKIPTLDSDALISKYLTVKGVRGHSYESVQIAIQTISSGAHPLERVCTHQFGLNQVDQAIRTAGGEIHPGAILVTVHPWMH